VRHATPADLGLVEDLLVELRRMPQLRERRPGYFSLGSRAFCHFHEDGGDIYVDVRLAGAFQRLRVAEPSERSAFLGMVRAALPPAP
jgi:hypothetical protein